MPEIKMEQRILDAFSETNRWWEGRFTLEYKDREIYAEIQKYLPLRHMIVLTGLRRVGKTTLMMKMVQDKIASGFDPKRILYFSFDDFSTVRLSDVVELYFLVLGSSAGSGDFLFLLDEVQKLKNWPDQVKRIYDERPDIKIVISGSESLFIRKRSRENLAGRFFEFHVRPLSFSEYLDFRNAAVLPTALHRREILSHLREYMISNGFPEMVGMDREIAARYIRENVLDRILFRDIPAVFGVRDPAVLRDVYHVLMQRPGAIIEMEAFSREFGISRQTLSQYLDHLENSYLIRRLYNFSRNARKSRRKLKKYYPAVIDPAIVERPEMSGPVFETFMIHLLNAEFFWRDAYKNEVDAVILAGDEVLPVEIKETPEKPKPLLLFMKKHGCKKGLMLTRDTETEFGPVRALPFYRYFLDEKETGI